MGMVETTCRVRTSTALPLRNAVRTRKPVRSAKTSVTVAPTCTTPPSSSIRRSPVRNRRWLSRCELNHTPAGSTRPAEAAAGARATGPAAHADWHPLAGLASGLSRPSKPPLRLRPRTRSYTRPSFDNGCEGLGRWQVRTWGRPCVPHAWCPRQEHAMRLGGQCVRRFRYPWRLTFAWRLASRTAGPSISG